MFKPFVLHEMIARGIAPNVKSAKNMLDRRPPKSLTFRKRLRPTMPILLNRAPTLHKLGILAFYPVLVEGNAIRLHPSVCSGFNADFDGDQMEVHVPLSKNSIEEVKMLMMANKNLLKPSDGSPVATPASKEMALGVYYLTSDDIRIKPSQSVFADKDEAVRAYQSGAIELRQLINVRVDGKVIETTLGRLLFNEVLPEGIEFINKSMSSGLIKELQVKALKSLDREKVVELIDAVWMSIVTVPE